MNVVHCAADPEAFASVVPDDRSHVGVKALPRFRFVKITDPIFGRKDQVDHDVGNRLRHGYCFDESGFQPSLVFAAFTQPFSSAFRLGWYEVGLSGLGIWWLIES